jgi:MEKHLA domain-containing protein
MLDLVFLARHTSILCASYQHWTGLPLIGVQPGTKNAVDKLFDAAFAVVSHDTQPDPVFNYANWQAQQLFGMDWDEITRLPSRYSAEEMNRIERVRLLQRVAQHGYVEDYCGVRIARDGMRFAIRNATVWNLLDEQGSYCGQAALIRDWSPL